MVGLKLNKKLLFFIILVLIVFPKKSGFTTIHIANRHSNCFGYTYLWEIPNTDSGTVEYCFGIPDPLHCSTKTTGDNEMIRERWLEWKNGNIDESTYKKNVNQIREEYRINMMQFQEQLNNNEIDKVTFKKKMNDLNDIKILRYNCHDEKYEYYSEKWYEIHPPPFFSYN